MLELALLIIAIAIIIWYFQPSAKETFSSDQKTIVLHYTDWCGACKLMKPIWFQVKQDFSRISEHALVMIENNEDTSRTPGIRSYPTIIKHHNGNETKYSGGFDVKKLKDWILLP
jgi:thiol-disulfide isomerase/thioredoxin